MADAGGDPGNMTVEASAQPGEELPLEAVPVAAPSEKAEPAAHADNVAPLADENPDTTSCAICLTARGDPHRCGRCAPGAWGVCAACEEASFCFLVSCWIHFLHHAKNPFQWGFFFLNKNISTAFHSRFSVSKLTMSPAAGPPGPGLPRLPRRLPPGAPRVGRRLGRAGDHGPPLHRAPPGPRPNTAGPRRALGHLSQARGALHRRRRPEGGGGGGGGGGGRTASSGGRGAARTERRSLGRG